jgi:tetratricopeptide (TPR) repeat protein
VFIAAHHYRLAAERAEPRRAFEVLRLAAERSFERAAFEDAATYFDHACSVRELGADPAHDVGALLVRRGHALRCAGKPSAAIACFVKAAGHARTLSDAGLFVAAALGYGITHKGFFDFQLIALLREANDKFGPHDPKVQAQLWTELAFALRQTAEQRAALIFAQQALAHARAAGDPLLLARALTAVRWNAVESRPMSELVAISNEALASALAAGDLSLVNDARLCLAWDLMLLGDADGLEREIRAYRSTSEQLRHGYDLLIVARFEAVRVLIGGNFEHAEALAKEALRLGRAGGDSTTDIVYSIEMLIPMRETGRLPELEKFIRFMEAVAPKPNVWAAAAAMMLAEAGRIDDAKREVATLAAQIPTADRDFNYLPMIALLAEACWRLGDAALGAHLADELRGYRDRHLVMGGASLYFGTVDRYFGLALGAAGDIPGALAALDAGVAAARSMQSPYWVARTELDLARLTPDRPLAARVRDDALRAGWATISREAAALC